MRRDSWTPPGYYVPTADAFPSHVLSACAHCGVLEYEHIGAKRFCPVAPREVRT